MSNKRTLLNQRSALGRQLRDAIAFPGAIRNRRPNGIRKHLSHPN
jgi:hypothetical protein